MRREQAVATMLVLLVASLVATAWWLAAARSGRPSASAADTAAGRSADPQPVARGASATRHTHGDAALARLDAALARTLPAAARLDPFAQRFAAPQLLSPERFVHLPTRLVRSASCATHPVLGQPAETVAERLLAHTYGIDPSERWPADYFFRTLTQFWTLGAEHYQISAVWDLGRPAVYRFEFYASPRADFSAEVLAVPAPLPAPERADALSATAYVAALAALYERQGARLGQRVVEAELATAAGAPVELRLADARVQYWRLDAALCVAAADAVSLHCQCQDAAGAGDTLAPGH